MSLIITGCMRSGTKTLAKVLGFHHEVQFNPGVTNSIINIQTEFEDEVSWMASPFIKRLESLGHTIIHLVRDPLAVINSLVGIHFWDVTHEESHLHAPYRDFIFEHNQGLANLWKMGASPLELSAYYYGYWNHKLIQKPRIRIEDVRNAPQLNQRPRARLTWSDVQKDIPEKLFVQLLKCCNTYGYSGDSSLEEAIENVSSLAPVAASE